MHHAWKSICLEFEGAAYMIYIVIVKCKKNGTYPSDLWGPGHHDGVGHGGGQPHQGGNVDRAARSLRLHAVLGWRKKTLHSQKISQKWYLIKSHTLLVWRAISVVISVVYSEMTVCCKKINKQKTFWRGTEKLIPIVILTPTKAS